MADSRAEKDLTSGCTDEEDSLDWELREATAKVHQMRQARQQGHQMFQYNKNNDGLFQNDGVSSEGDSTSDVEEDSMNWTQNRMPKHFNPIRGKEKAPRQQEREKGAGQGQLKEDGRTQGTWAKALDHQPSKLFDSLDLSMSRVQTRNLLMRSSKETNNAQLDLTVGIEEDSLAKVPSPIISPKKSSRRAQQIPPPQDQQEVVQPRLSFVRPKGPETRSSQRYESEDADQSTGSWFSVPAVKNAANSAVLSVPVSNATATHQSASPATSNATLILPPDTTSLAKLRKQSKRNSLVDQQTSAASQVNRSRHRSDTRPTYQFDLDQWENPSRGSRSQTGQSHQSPSQSPQRQMSGHNMFARNEWMVEPMTQQALPPKNKVPNQLCDRERFQEDTPVSFPQAPRPKSHIQAPKLFHKKANSFSSSPDTCSRNVNYLRPPPPSSKGSSHWTPRSVTSNDTDSQSARRTNSTEKGEQNATPYRPPSYLSNFKKKKEKSSAKTRPRPLKPSANNSQGELPSSLYTKESSFGGPDSFATNTPSSHEMRVNPTVKTQNTKGRSGCGNHPASSRRQGSKRSIYSAGSIHSQGSQRSNASNLENRHAWGLKETDEQKRQKQLMKKKKDYAANVPKPKVRAQVPRPQQRAGEDSSGIAPSNSVPRARGRSSSVPRQRSYSQPRPQSLNKKKQKPIRTGAKTTERCPSPQVKIKRRAGSQGRPQKPSQLSIDEKRLLASLARLDLELAEHQAQEPPDKSTCALNSDRDGFGNNQTPITEERVLCESVSQIPCDGNFPGCTRVMRHNLLEPPVIRKPKEDTREECLSVQNCDTEHRVQVTDKAYLLLSQDL